MQKINSLSKIISRSRANRHIESFDCCFSIRDRSREAIRSSTAHLASPGDGTERNISVDAVRALLTDIDHEEIGSIVKEFSAVYLDAAALENGETAEIMRKASRILGYHLASDVGPRAAGVSVN